MIPAEIFADTLRALLAPIHPFLEDPSVSEVLINGPNQVFVERRGKLELTSARFASSAEVLAALRNVAQYAGTFVDDQNPILEARLPDGSRVEALTAPLVEGGPAVAIRRFSRATLTLERLVALGAMSEEAAQVLRACSVGKCNIVVAGGTGSGKTSLLNVLAACVPNDERILVLEDTREIDIAHTHVLYLEARKPDAQGEGAITIRDLFRASLRMRPDRILVGEIRGAEALDMIQAMVSGHGGCLSTLHATHPRDTLTRLETMCMMSDVSMPLPAIRMQIGSGIDLIVQVARLRGGKRGVTHITEVVGFDPTSGQYELRDLFTRRYDPVEVEGEVRSQLVPTGAIPTFLPNLLAHGVSLPTALFEAAPA